MDRRAQSRILLVSLVLVAALALGFVFAGSTSAQTVDITVAEDDSGDYTSIQTAVDNANDTDRIEVQSGVYNESVQIDKNITLVAPDGATISNTSTESSNAGLQIFGTTTPEIAGFTVTGWQWGLSTGASEGDWVARDLTVRDNTYGVLASGTPGNWTLSNTTIEAADTAITTYEASGEHVITGVTIRDTEDDGISASSTTGGWTVSDTIIENVSDDGIDTYNSSSDWQVQDTNVTEAGEAGVEATDTTGNWRIRNSTFVNSGEYGIEAFESTGDWTVENVSVRNSSYRGISVDYSNGSWTIRSTSIQNVSVEGLDAYRTDNGRIQDVAITDIGQDGINLYDTGSWEVENTTISQVGDDGINAGAGDTTGSQTVQNVTVRDAGNRGLTFYNSSADWTVTDSTVETSVNESIEAENTTGNWKITRSVLSDGSVEAVNASDAVLTGNASYNYWGASDGPSGDFDGSGGAAIGNLIVAPYYSDADLTTAETTGFVDVDVTALPGSGTETDPYIIENASELQAMEDDPSANYTLDSDIDAVDTSEWNGNDGFDPIGGAPFSGNEFNGSLDGNGHTIVGLTINRPTEDNVGLFSTVKKPLSSSSTAGTISNVSVTDADITGNNSVGTIAGANFGIINSSYATGTVNGSTTVGGLVGENNGESNFGLITQSYARVAVDGSTTVAGLVGVHGNGGAIGSTYAVGSVNGSSTTGGLVADSFGGDSVRNSYWNTESTGQSATAVNATGLTTEEMTGSAASANMSGFDFAEVWETQADDYPILVLGGDDSNDDTGSSQAVVNKTASSVTPTNVTANESTTYTVNVTIDNTTLTDAEGDVNVVFENHSLDIDDDSLDGPEEDLKINYTSANLTDGTLNVSTTVSGTAPTTAGSYPINVTDLEVYTADGDEMLIEDANVTIESIDVSPSVSETVVVNATDGVGDYNTIQSAVDDATNGTTVLVEDGTYPEEVTIAENISLVAESDEVVLNGSTIDGTDGITITDDVAGVFIDGLTVTEYSGYGINASGTDATWSLLNGTIQNVSRGVYAFESSGDWTVENTTIAEVDDMGIDAAKSSGEWHIESTTITNASSVGISTELITKRGSVTNSTVTNSNVGIGITGNVSVWYSTVEDNDVGISAWETTEAWTVGESRIQNNTEGIEVTDATVAGNATYNYWGADDGPSGDFDGSGDPAVGNVSVSPFYSDEALTTLDETSEMADPIINTTASSVIPSTATADEFQEYTVNVTIDNTTLTDESGVVDVAFENFTLDSAGDELRINYTASNISEGTLSVSGSINATAPASAGTYAVNLTEVWVDGPDEGPVENANLTIDTIEVGEAADPVVNETASSVTPLNVTANETETYAVNVTIDNTTLSDAEGDVNVVFENFSLDIDDDSLEGPEEDLKINYTSANLTDGTLSVSTTVSGRAPTTAGSYPINVTDLEVYGTGDGDELLIEDANETISTVQVGEAVGPTVNTTASSITPTLTTINETNEYTLNVTIDNTTLTDEHGEIDVRGEGTTEDTINFTGADISDGTLSVSETGNRTAPATPGVYAVNVTDLRVENTSEVLLADANITIGNVTVTEPVVNETASSVTPTTATANDTQRYDVNVTLQNTSLTDESGEVDVGFEAFDLDLADDDQTDDTTEEDLTIGYTALNITNGTLTVSASVNATAPNSSGTYNVSVTDLRREQTTEDSLIEDASITFANISVTDSTEALDLALDETTIPNGTATNLTAAATLADGTTQDVTTAANLTSSDETVVTVDNTTGVVSAVGQGTALLNASYDGIDATTAVTVGPAEPTSLDVTLGQEVIRSDAETSVTVTAELTNGSIQDVTSLVALESSDETVVTADNATGTVTGQGAGSATVTASYEDVTASAPIDVTVPPLAVDRTTIDFGDITLVNSSVAQLNVTNNASTPITVASATLAGNDTDQFSIDESAITGEIPAETNRTVEVAFEPFIRTSSNATLTISAADPALSPANVSLSGTGTATNLTLTANRSSIVAGDPVRFNVTDDDGTPINATIRLPDTTAQTGDDGNATVRIETIGNLTAAATKGSNTTAYAPDSVPITVVAPTLSVSDTTLDFGDTSLGTTGQANLTLVNNNATDVEVGAVDLFGANASQFGLDTSTLPESVAANSERNVSVRYEPFERGSAAASVAAAGETVSLSGTGVAPRPNITAGLPIEITAQQGGSTNTTLQITNDGNAPLNATLSSDNDEFSHPSELDIAADATGSVDIQFAPDSDDTGTLTTELVIAAESPALSEIRLTAAGTVEERSVALRRSEIDFGEVTVGSPATSTVTVDNTGTTTETLSVTTTNRTLFNLSDPADETIELAPGTSERLTIEANLSSSGAATEALLIQNDSFTSVNTTATLNATGQAPALSVATDEPVGFDNTPVNSTSTAEIQLDNDGTAPLVVNLTAAFNATEAANFSVVGESVFEVPADDSRPVTVGFTPQTAGTATANLSLDTNDIAATTADENVTLEATGFETNLSIVGDSSTFGTVGVGGTTSRTVTVANNGTSDLTLSETVAGDFAVTSAPGTIEGGTAGEITVQFAPTANATRTGTLTITGTDQATDETTTVSTPLVGTGRYGELRVNQGTLRTGVTTTDSSTTGSVTVENVGLAGTQLSIDDISVSGGSFSLDTSGLTEGDVLGSGQGDALSVTFDPAADAANGEQTGTLTLTASSADGTKTVTRTLGLTGIVSTPEPTVSTDGLSVGTVTVGDQEFRTVTVSNDGGEAFEITGTSTTDAGVTADRRGPSRIVPGGEATFVVIVNQSATGSFDTDLTIETDDDTDPTVSVTGRAVAPELSVTAEAVAFGDTGVGSAGQATVTIQNTGNATLAVAEPTITGSGAGEFSLLSGDRRLRIGPDSSQTVRVGFSPSNTSLSEANLQIEPLNDPTDTQGTRTISLNGTGTDAAAALNQSAVGFGDIERGQTVNQTLRLTNDGNAPLDVTGSASILGADSGAFSVSGLGTPTISPGASETFEIELDTSGLGRGSLSSRVVIPTDDADVTSYLGATVVAPDIETPGTVAADSFGTTRLGTTATAEVLVNNTGNAELNLTELSVTGIDAAAFSVVETPDNTTVAAQDTGRVVVEFDPSALDNAASRAQNTPLEAAATLNVSSNDPDAGEQFAEVGLNGEAVTPSLSVPRTFQFGDVPIGQTTTGELTVENTPSATAALNVTALEISGADDGDYTASLSGASTPASLAPGESVTVQVNLTPSSFDQKYATLSVETDDSRETVRKVGLSNTDTVYSVSYGSINVQYINPTEGTEPTVNVDRGFRGRNATLRSVNSNVSTTEDYSLNYTFGDDPTAIGHDEALNDSDAEGNVTAVQYINATTSADESKFTESTFQTEVSKATLARGNVDPGNVTIYHENGDSYDALDTELLYETTRGYVYEVTTDSYSVFAVGHPETTATEQTDDTDDDTDDSTDDSTDDTTDTTDDGSTGGGGGGGATSNDQQDDTPIADIVQNVADLAPQTESESEITDSDPDRAGVTVAPTDTESVSTITFADETVSGTVSVKEYRPDADLTTQIESSVNADLDAAAGATDSSASSGGDGGDAGDGSSASNVRLVSVTDISPSSDQATASAATVELTVDRDDLDEPTNAFVVHETANGWERLETTVEETDGGTVSLSAETDSFSLFAVVEDQPSTGTDDGGQQPETESSTTDGSDGDTGGDSGGASTLLLVVGILAALAVLGAVLAVVRRE